MKFASGRSVSGATVDQEKGVGMDRWEYKIADLTKVEKDIGEVRSGSFIRSLCSRGECRTVESGRLQRRQRVEGSRSTRSAQATESAGCTDMLS